MTKWWSLSVEGLLSRGPTPSSCYQPLKYYQNIQIIHQENMLLMTIHRSEISHIKILLPLPLLPSSSLFLCVSLSNPLLSLLDPSSGSALKFILKASLK